MAQTSKGMLYGVAALAIIGIVGVGALASMVANLQSSVPKDIRTAIGGIAENVKGGEQTYKMLAIEPSGTAGDDEAFLPKGTVAKFRYALVPSVIFARVGDKVNLEIAGINGKIHPTNIEGLEVEVTGFEIITELKGVTLKKTPTIADFQYTDPDTKEKGWNVYRGFITKVALTPEKPGLYKIQCDTHPEKTGWLFVLPKA